MRELEIWSKNNIIINIEAKEFAVISFKTNDSSLRTSNKF
jgi:hypothetical protein